MKVQRTEKIVFSFELSGREAELLAGLIQDPICDPSEEPEEIAELRHNLFDAINAAILSGRRRASGG